MADTTDTIGKLIQHAARKYGDDPFLETRRGMRIIRYTFLEIERQSSLIAGLLEKKKIAKGERVLIWGQNSPEWVCIFIAALRQGIVAVPVDYRTTFETVEKFIAQTDPKAIFVSKLLRPDPKFHAEKVYFIEDIFETVKALGPAKEADVHPDDLAEILFTSGTTGEPKGVMLSHCNILTSVDAMTEFIHIKRDLKTLSLLPLSHIFEQIVGLFIPLKQGARVAYLTRINSATILDGIRRHKATTLIVVPRMMSLLLEAIERKAEKDGKKEAFTRAIAFASKIPSRGLRKLIFKKVHQAMGNHLELFVCGGAPLEERIGRTWEAMGFRVYQGYGATETAGLTTLNIEGKNRIIFAGIPPKGVDIKLADDNEVLVRGGFIFSGYWKDSEKTKKTLVDGWYRTGDMGKMEGRWLKLLGREKFRIVLPDGRKVYPEDIESKLGNHPDVKACCVIPTTINGEKAVFASIVIDPAKNADTIIKEVNKNLESAQQIAHYGVWPTEDFPRTKTLKIDRAEVEKTITQGLGAKVAEKDAAAKTQKIDTVIAILSRISKLSPDAIKPESNLVTDLKLDSLSRLELVAQIEEEIGVMLDESKISTETTVAQIQEMCKNPAPPVSDGHKEWPRSPLMNITRVILQNIIVFPVHALFVPLSARGKENLKKASRPCIFYANHIGAYDVLCGLRTLSNKERRRLIVAANSHLWEEHHFYGFLFDSLVNCVPLEPNGVNLRYYLSYIGEKMDEGYSMLIFPEGHIPPSGIIEPFRRGTGMIAVELGVDVIPIRIQKEYNEIFPFVDMNLKNLFPKKRKRIRVSIGKPLHFAQGTSYEDATNQMTDAMKALPP